MERSGLVAGVALLAFATVAFGLAGCDGRQATLPSVPVRLTIDLDRVAPGSADGGTRAGHRAGGYHAAIEGERLAFSGTVEPATSRVSIAGARGVVMRRGGRFTVRLSGLQRHAVVRVRASGQRAASVDEVDIVRTRSAIPSAREPQQREPDRGPPGNADAGGGRIDIDARDFAFAPSPVRATVGQQVVWRNQDRDDHALRSVRGPAGAVLPRSGRLRHGDRYDLTLLKPGAHSYICAIHPWMRGTIIARAG